MAETANLSLFYYQRLFKRLIKKPVGEYIKLRCLARAVEDLKLSDQRILDVAVSYGFSSHANFTRAFKEAYGLTPEEYRREQSMLNTFERLAVSTNYVLIDEGVPLIVGGIVLEIHRITLLQPEVYIGFTTLMVENKSNLKELSVALGHYDELLTLNVDTDSDQINRHRGPEYDSFIDEILPSDESQVIDCAFSQSFLNYVLPNGIA